MKLPQAYHLRLAFLETFVSPVQPEIDLVTFPSGVLETQPEIDLLALNRQPQCRCHSYGAYLLQPMLRRPILLHWDGK